MKKDYSYPVPVDMITHKEKRYNLDADESDRASVADILKLPRVNIFKAKYVVKGYKKSTLIEVKGEFEANITQNCVVSLEDFDKDYSGEFRVMYDSKLKQKFVKDDEECDVRELDAPEVILGAEIDLVHVALEQLSLLLDDYPRQDNVSFDFKPEFTEETIKAEKKNPFEILASLKK